MSDEVIAAAQTAEAANTNVGVRSRLRNLRRLEARSALLISLTVFFGIDARQFGFSRGSTDALIVDTLGMIVSCVIAWFAVYRVEQGIRDGGEGRWTSLRYFESWIAAAITLAIVYKVVAP